MPKIADLLEAIDYIEANLTRKIDLGMVAKAAHYSACHLHRSFSQTFGMTVRAYRQRRQLTEAARRLAFTDAPVLDVALSSGYGSQQAFHQAFVALYKSTPGNFRTPERFYPLQLRYDFQADPPLPSQADDWQAVVATEADLPGWRSLLPLIVDGFPHLREADHLDLVRRRLARGEALVVKDSGETVGATLFSQEARTIDFMGVHPLYRRSGIPAAFLDKVAAESPGEGPISTTTYREGDRADTGQRRRLLGLGFRPAGLMTEFGYPTQRLVLAKTETDG